MFKVVGRPFLKKIQRFEVGRYPLAEKRDAKISISISHDKSTARAQTEKAWGGQKLTAERVKAEIQKAKLAELCIDQDKLSTLISSEEAVDLTLANAIPAKDGSNAHLEQLLESKTLTQHDTNSDDAIDQHEVYNFSVVEPGEKLLRKIPASNGQDGMDVTGKKIKAKAGIDIQFQKPFEGVDISEEDENVIVASEKGHPVFSKAGVKVDKLMLLENIDIHSGNINYDGSLLVKHNIEAGFSVEVSGDVFVKGTVTKATVKAGGSIEVSGGVNADDIDDEHGCHLEAKGDVTAKFFHHASVHCDGDLHAHEYLMQCRVRVEGFINAGQQRGRGCIIGGHSYSNSGVNAKTLGSDAYVTTSLVLGSDDEAQREASRLKRKIKKRCFEEDQLSKILKKIQSEEEPTNIGRTTLDKARKIENTVAVLQRKIAEMNSQLAQLQERLKTTEELFVKVSNRIYPNVVVTISGHTWSCEEARKCSQLHLQDDGIAIEHI